MLHNRTRSLAMLGLWLVGAFLAAACLVWRAEVA